MKRQVPQNHVEQTEVAEVSHSQEESEIQVFPLLMEPWTEANPVMIVSGDQEKVSLVEELTLQEGGVMPHFMMMMRIITMEVH